MFNMTEMMQAAHGGEAVNSLSRQFGISPAQTQQAVDALLPALTLGLQKQTEATQTFGALMTTMLTGDHARYFDQPSAAAQPEAAQAGQQILQQLFGAHSQAMSQQIASHAAAVSGINSAILARMLPVLASMIMGAMFRNAAAQVGDGGGLFGQVMNAARNAGAGGLGGMWKQPFPQAPASQSAAGSSHMSQPSPGSPLDALNGYFNSIAPGAQQQQPAAPPPTGSAPPLNPMSVGLDALRNMFQTGSAAQQQHVKDFQSMFETMLGAKPR